MRLSGVLAGVLTIAALSSAPALAGDPVRTTADARGVLICGQDAASRRAYVRQYGARPVFITAREALSLRPGEVWTAPRCMTERQHRLYRQAAAAAPRR